MRPGRGERDECFDGCAGHIECGDLVGPSHGGALERQSACGRIRHRESSDFCRDGNFAGWLRRGPETQIEESGRDWHEDQPDQ
jgi:hypothetical protein